MQSIVMLTNEIPYLMAPATLIAAILVISSITAIIRLTEQAFKVMMLGTMVALTAAAFVMNSIL